MAIDYKALSEENRKALKQVGLTTHQAGVYEALIHYGPQKATRLAFLAAVPRTLSYKVLDELVAQGLVHKNDERGGVSIFSPAHPLKLKELIEQRLQAAQAAKVTVVEVLPNLMHDFNHIVGAIPQEELYAQVAMYAGKAALEPLTASERSILKESLKNLLENVEK